MKIVIKNKIKRLLKRIKQHGLIQIPGRFLKIIIPAYKNYAVLLSEVNSNAVIYLTSGGMGDVYVYGMYFNKYIEKNKITDYVFTVPGNPGKQVAELYGIKNIKPIPIALFRQFMFLSIFLGDKKTNIDILHYHIIARYTGILTRIEGLHGLFLSQMIYYTRFDSIPLKEQILPVFDCDDIYLDSVFQDNELLPGKTVLLCPYAKSVKQLSALFWNRLASALQELGYCVCTNIGSNPGEKAVPGTKGICVPIKSSVPFLEKAGCVIGLRSGFMDVISGADCKKIVLYPLQNYARGIVADTNSFFSLSNMFGCDACEITVDLKNQLLGCNAVLEALKCR